MDSPDEPRSSRANHGVAEWVFSPGTTQCKDCGSLIATPNNEIPGSWLSEHVGHTVEVMMARPDSPVGFKILGLQ